MSAAYLCRWCYWELKHETSVLQQYAQYIYGVMSMSCSALPCLAPMCSIYGVMPSSCNAFHQYAQCMVSCQCCSWKPYHTQYFVVRFPKPCMHLLITLPFSKRTTLFGSPYCLNYSEGNPKPTMSCFQMLVPFRWPMGFDLSINFAIRYFWVFLGMCQKYNTTSKDFNMLQKWWSHNKLNGPCILADISSLGTYHLSSKSHNISLQWRR